MSVNCLCWLNYKWNHSFKSHARVYQENLGSEDQFTWYFTANWNLHKFSSQRSLWGFEAFLLNVKFGRAHLGWIQESLKYLNNVGQLIRLYSCLWVLYKAFHSSTLFWVFTSSPIPRGGFCVTNYNLMWSHRVLSTLGGKKFNWNEIQSQFYMYRKP